MDLPRRLPRLISLTLEMVFIYFYCFHFNIFFDQKYYTILVNATKTHVHSSCSTTCRSFYSSRYCRLTRAQYAAAQRVQTTALHIDDVRSNYKACAKKLQITERCRVQRFKAYLASYIQNMQQKIVQHLQILLITWTIR
jgi:hypothetical protein